MPSLYCHNGHPNPPDHRFCALCGSPLSVAPGGMEPQVLGDRYRLKQELGHGGFGRTYLAEDLHRFNELCVLKEFAPQVHSRSGLEKAKELFEREAGVLYRLKHPQIPQFRELFQATTADQGRLFLVQDYVQGKTYRQLLEMRQPQRQHFTEPEIVQLLQQLLPVLHYIHSAGVIHRDISPDNLMLRDTDQLPVLIDFGGVKQVAAIAASVFVSTNPTPDNLTRLGKVGYAPAEQMQSGNVFPHSDLYALAMTVLVLLTGQEPYELLQSDLDRWLSRLRDPQLIRVLPRMLASHPVDRCQSAAEVLHLLSFPSSPVRLEPSASAQASRVPTAHPPIHPFTPLPSRITPRSPHFARTAAITLPPAPSRSGNWWVGLFTLVVVVGLSLGGWQTRDRWLPVLRTLVENPQTVEEGSDSNANFSQDEQARKAALIARRQALGVDAKFLTQITNATFFQRFPDQQGRILTDQPEDAEWRSRWDDIANEWLDVMENHLSAEARQRLGQYGAGDRDGWKRRVNAVYVGSRSLNDVTDAKFFQLFPDWKGQEFIDQPIGQLWQAIALDQVAALEAGTMLERIRFESGALSQQVSGTLAPGEGRVYIASLTTGQILRLNLQANAASTSLSIYLPRPTSDLPYLLEDSDEFVWSGQLPQSGFYEFTVVADGGAASSYQLNLAVDNVTTTTVEPPQPEDPSAKN